MNVQRNLFAKIKANINRRNFPSLPPSSQALINLFVDSLCIALHKAIFLFIIPAHTHNRPNGRIKRQSMGAELVFLASQRAMFSFLPCFFLIYNKFENATRTYVDGGNVRVDGSVNFSLSV